MSPLLHLLIIATTTITSPSTHPTTIHTNPVTEERTTSMATQDPNPKPPQFHPPKAARATDRIGQRAGGPINLNAKLTGNNTIANEGRTLTPIEHTSRPR